MISFQRIGALMAALMLLTGSLSMTSCKKEETDKASSDAKTSQSSSQSAKNSKSSSKDAKSSSKGNESSSKDGESSSKGSESSSKESGSSSKSSSSSSKSDKGASSGSEKAASEPQSAEAAQLAAMPVPPGAAQYKSQNIYVLNLDSGKPVYAVREDERIAPASITKVMTCLLALELVGEENLDSESATLTADINNYLYTQGVDTLGGIKMGESLSIRDLIYAMMLQSANDAAMMVGKYVSTKDPRAPEGGDLEVFVQMMNEKAKEIGAINTHFTNPSGLSDENNYSTAKDLALITKYAWEHPKYGEIFQEITTTNAYTSKPTNRMPEGITWYSSIYPQQSSQTKVYKSYIRGIKTGSLPGDENLRNYVSVATQDGYSYLASVCNAPIRDAESGKAYDLNLAFVDAGKIYDWCFEMFQVKTLMNVGDLVTSVPINLAWDVESVNLVAADKFATLVTTETTSDNVTLEPVFPSAKTRTGKNKETEYYFDAPIQKGDELGYVKIKTANLELGRVRLVAANRVERSDWLYYMEKVKGFMGQFVFKFILSLLVIFIVLYVLLMVIRNHNKKRYRMRAGPRRGQPAKRSEPPKSRAQRPKRPKK